MDYVFSIPEVLQNLREQLLGLNSSCIAYDSGNYWEAKRMATSVFAICHDVPLKKKNKSLTKSLLNQLDLKNNIIMMSTADARTPDMIPWTPLALLKKGEGLDWHFAPSLEQFPLRTRMVSFQEWWEESVFRTPEGRTLNRKLLVSAMRSQDNGSHSDEGIRNSEYAILRNYNDFRLTRKKSGYGSGMLITPHRRNIGEIPEEEEPIPRAHLATMRQISFELLQSIKEFF